MGRVINNIVLVAALMLVGHMASAQVPEIEKYVEEWAPTAVREMYRSGVPASITLAQGILESRYGLSPLAADGNNHFGIKCHKDWTGKKQYHDDDEKGECFRVYDDADESFRDHSDFLRYRDRYKFLFEFETTDYKSWANGLKKAGYATDPGYPDKLIKYIEDYKLNEYDSMSLAQAEELLARSKSDTERPGASTGSATGKDRSLSTAEGSSKADRKAETNADKRTETKADKKSETKVEKKAETKAEKKAEAKAEKAERKAACPLTQTENWVCSLKRASAQILCRM